MGRISPIVEALIEPSVTSLGYEFVGGEYFPQGKHSLLRVYIDHEAGVTVDDCALVSNQISGVLDVEDAIKGNYTLEVSSPGLDRPLFTLEHFKKFVGSNIKVKLSVPIEGRRKIVGTLFSVKDNDIVIYSEQCHFNVPIDAIDKANLVPEF